MPVPKLSPVVGSTNRRPATTTSCLTNSPSCDQASIVRVGGGYTNKQLYVSLRMAPPAHLLHRTRPPSTSTHHHPPRSTTPSPSPSPPGMHLQWGCSSMPAGICQAPPPLHTWGWSHPPCHRTSSGLASWHPCKHPWPIKHSYIHHQPIYQTSTRCTSGKPSHPHPPTHVSSSSLDVLGRPPEALPVAHPLDHAAHEDLQWPHLGVSKVHLALAGGVGQAQPLP